MKIKRVSEIHSFTVVTDEDEHYEYTRYAADSWYVMMGESNEPVYNCEELERLFQQYTDSRKEAITSTIMKSATPNAQ